MTNLLKQAINCDDGDRAAEIIQDALGIENDDVVNHCFPETWPEDRKQRAHIIGFWLQRDPFFGVTVQRRFPPPEQAVCFGRSAPTKQDGQCPILRANCSLLVHRGNLNPAGSFALATALSPTIQCLSFSRSPQSMWRARSAKRHRPTSGTMLRKTPTS